MDYIRSPTRACHCQFRRYRIYEGRRPDKAVVADEAYRVCEVIGTGYIVNGIVRRRPPERSYFRGRIEMEIYA